MVTFSFGQGIPAASSFKSSLSSCSLSVFKRRPWLSHINSRKNLQILFAEPFFRVEKYFSGAKWWIRRRTRNWRKKRMPNLTMNKWRDVPAGVNRAKSVSVNLMLWVEQHQKRFGGRSQTTSAFSSGLYPVKAPSSLFGPIVEFLNFRVVHERLTKPFLYNKILWP